MQWRPARAFAKVAVWFRVRHRMTLESFQNLVSVALGFAIAGSFCSGYQLATNRLPSFSQLNKGVSAAALASIPVLVFAAPFLIMRNTVLGAIQDGRQFKFVFFATLLAGFWSLMSGTVVVTALQALGILIA
jgi:hypothetical protein